MQLEPICDIDCPKHSTFCFGMVDLRNKMRILGRFGDANYLIGEGNPDDPMQLCSIANLETGVRFRPVPLAQHLKFIDSIDEVSQDQELLTRLLSLPMDSDRSA